MVFPKDNRMPREKELIVSFSKFHNSLCMCITQYQVLQIPELLNKIHNHCFFRYFTKKKNLPENSDGGKFGRKRCIQEEERKKNNIKRNYK